MSVKMAAIDADEFFQAVRQDFNEFMQKNPVLSRFTMLDDLREICSRLDASREMAVSYDDLALSSALYQLGLGLFLVHFGSLKASGSVH